MTSSEITAYTGRFAPSPTGPLHFGSLLAALASYLDARKHQGQWLLRIEDLDPPREDPTAADQILQVLDDYGLHWDGSVRYQSQRGDAYQQRLSQLQQQHAAFPCQCSRKQLAGSPHHGNCQCHATDDIAWRFLCPGGMYSFNDQIQGLWQENLDDIGDFVLKRRDGPWSYQLAVVTDDIDQSITHIVRGIDLIDSTARQGVLYQALGQAVPQYAHIPVAMEANGQKLSKQNLALPLSSSQANQTLFQALHWLRQHPPAELQGADSNELLSWAVANWNINGLSGLQEIPAPTAYQRSPSAP